MIEGSKGRPPHLKPGFVPPRRRVPVDPDDALYGGRGWREGPRVPPAAPGSSAPRFRRSRNGALFFMNPCPYCGLRGTLYYRRLSGTWRCMQCKLPFTDSGVTRGEFREVHDVVREVTRALKGAADTLDLDDFPGAAEYLLTMETWSQRAREIIARQARALAEERELAGT